MALSKTLLVVATAAVMTVSYTAVADVSLSGNMGFKVVSTDSDDENVDLVWKSSKARLKAKGVREIANGTKVIGEIEIDYDDGANAGGSGIEVRTARMILVGEFGTLLMAGRTASGQHAKLVGPVDIFNNGGAAFFEQPSRAPNVLAYVTPTIAGGLNLIVAGIAAGTNNGEDLDATVFRAQYKNDMFSAAAGIVSYPSDETRIALAGSTKVGAVTIGASFESTKDDPTFGEKDVAGFTAAFDAGNAVTVSAGFNTILKGKATGQEDASAYQLMIQKSLGDGVSVWAEYDGYNDEAAKDNQIALGMNLSF